MSKRGIDISTHNGKINFQKLKSEIDFCMIRAGYSNTVDERFHDYAKQCTENKIPFGVYWFSYATSVDEVVKEAKTCLETIKNYKLSLPIAFDWEYDSDAYFKKRIGRNATNSERNTFARAFCEHIKANGYTPMLYTNVDYYDNKGFYALDKVYPIWLAHWGVKTPKYSCKMWQYSSTGTVKGINGYVDMDTCYMEFTADVTEKENPSIESVCKKFNTEYTNLAKDIIAGKYGNGAERKNKLKSLGFDYDFAQSLVNVMV